MNRFPIFLSSMFLSSLGFGFRISDFGFPTLTFPPAHPPTFEDEEEDEDEPHSPTHFPTFLPIPLTPIPLTSPVVCGPWSVVSFPFYFLLSAFTHSLSHFST